MTKATVGDTVEFHYTVKQQDGEVFDSSAAQGGAVQAALGAGQLVPGVDMSLVGMNEGEKQTVSLDPDEAYGERDEQLVFTLDRKKLPGELVPEIEMEITLSVQDQEVVAKVVKVEDDQVTLDANHPLAGQRVQFELELVKVLSKKNG